ncbi:DUF4294 domain-containing protein [Flavihumibacter fluvii]|uniref:DUF4294 domain-containing protein n=1 Tax=Flavihumibacter fluvii TaxID=2838157 RepID=UPI001BDEECDF|nr:DUF4294 domain-containing protein [Flavihumibacter fluvii]ULQ54322.1 DUF4294 domain-containing protein [Flavihumibacter fluvii]
MRHRLTSLYRLLVFAAILLSGYAGYAQTPAPVPNDPRFGPNDTIIVPIYVFQGDTLPSGVLQYVYVNAPMPPAMRRRYEKWTRLRNAVYVTYPYARKAGLIINDINLKLERMPEKQHKAYIQSREKELKKEFTAPLTNLSVYQGRVLMKLINRQTGNNCYSIIKEYKGGFTASFWQTVAFFFGSSLKQPYDPMDEDREIETIVREVEKLYN